MESEKERTKYFKKIKGIKDRMPRVKPIFDHDYVVRPSISPDGRTIAIAGSYNVYFVNPVTLELVISHAISDRAYYLKMTNGHVFVKHYIGNLVKEWSVISYKGTNLLNYLRAETKIKDFNRL